MGVCAVVSSPGVLILGESCNEGVHQSVVVSLIAQNDIGQTRGICYYFDVFAAFMPKGVFFFFFGVNLK